MFTAVLCAAAVLWIPGLIVLVVSARRAPVGFEAADGFHAIEEPTQSAALLGSPVHAG